MRWELLEVHMTAFSDDTTVRMSLLTSHENNVTCIYHVLRS